MLHNNMKKIIFVLSALALLNAEAKAQQAPDTPKGQTIVQIFGDFHSGFGKQDNDRGFALERSYLGYQYRLADNLTVKAVMNVGKSADVDDYQRMAYLKHAQVTYSTGQFTLDGGLISTTQFNMLEKFWGYRYVSKSFQDEYKFGSSADLGISTQWKAADWLCLDAIVVNGEGYKKVQVQNGLQYGVGATLTAPCGLTMRLYASVNEQVAGDAKNTQNYSAFLGYKTTAFSIGAEYNFMAHAGGKEGCNQSGVSAYAKVKVGKAAEVFARYDNLFSENDWNKAGNDRRMIMGAQWKLGKYIKVAPNVRYTMPKAHGGDNKVAGYVNCFVGI